MPGADTTDATRWSPRERQVLDLIAAGRTNAEIAAELGISWATAKWHVSEIISKAGVSSREDVGEYWRSARRPAARAARLLRRFALTPLFWKMAAGTGAAALVAGGGVAMVGSVARGDARLAPVLQAVLSPTPVVATPTPTPTQPRPFETSESVFSVRPCNAQDPIGSCSPDADPELARFRKGSACDYSGANFTGMPALGFVDFRGCNLAGARFGAGLFPGNDFTGADLRGAVFGGALFASMPQSVFDGADLRETTITGVLAGASFLGANLQGATIKAIQADEARWNGAICPDGTASEANGDTCIGAGVTNVDPRRGAATTSTPVPGGP